jgi:hypothetical protein
VLTCAHALGLRRVGKLRPSGKMLAIPRQDDYTSRSSRY